MTVSNSDSDFSGKSCLNRKPHGLLDGRKFRERECAEKAIEVLEALLPAGIHSLQDA